MKKRTFQRKQAVKHIPRKVRRSEQDVLADLQALCTSPGYVHAVAYLCFRDNMLICTEQITEKDVQDRFSPSRLLRTESTRLLG